MAKRSPSMAKKSSGQIRIISGQWRGRKLPVPDSPGLRPTTDRVRETLFNWLAPVLHGARCLDCFAGSGALGLEALSRYADHVVLLEFERHVADTLQKNVRDLGSTRAEVVHTDTLNYLNKNGKPFDVVFIDPPFRRDMLTTCCQYLEHNHWLAAEAYIYVEAEVDAGHLAVPDSWQLHREKVAGQVAYRLYIRCADENESEMDDKSSTDTHGSEINGAD
ncbi:MAG: 16S rRNA (guanine(966)-N(2))-methyltransferase [Plesiomonas sp.]